MKRRVTIRARAREDLEQACLWYNRQQAGLGERLLAEVRHAIQIIRKRPESFPVYHRGFRRALLAHFPYKLFFLSEGDRVIIFRILHASRHHPQELE